MVLAIIAVMTSVLVPNVRGNLKGVRVREAALTLAEHVRYAQMLAVEQGRPVRVAIDRERRGYQVEVADDASGASFHTAAVSGEAFIRLAEGVEFKSVETGVAPDGGRDSLWFEPAGAWSSGKVRLTDGDRKFEVRVGGSLGQVEVVDAENGARDQQNAEEADLLASTLVQPK